MGKPLAECPLRIVRERFDQHAGDAQTKHPIAEEFEAFVARPARASRTGMGERFDQKLGIGEMVSKRRFDGRKFRT